MRLKDIGFFSGTRAYRFGFVCLTFWPGLAFLPSGKKKILEQGGGREKPRCCLSLNGCPAVGLAVGGGAFWVLCTWVLTEDTSQLCTGKGISRVLNGSLVCNRGRLETLSL